MAEEKLNVGTYQQILTVLSQLATNYTSVFTDYYNMFYNETPMDITLQVYDEDGNLNTIKVPNRAKDRTYLLNGRGEPEGFVSASRGATYQDLGSGSVYIKLAGEETVNGWSPITTQANLDTYILQGEGSPEGLVESSMGIIYVDMLNAQIYIKSTSTGNTGWLSINTNVINPANSDLSNLTPTGENRFANRSLSNLSADGSALMNRKEDVNNKVTTIVSSSTNTQYPSAKAVYSQLVLKENVSNKVAAITSSSTDTQYPSAKAVYTLVSSDVAGKENASNKVTTITSSSTNTQYPSAKAVYTQLASKENSSNKITAITSSATDAQYPSAKATYNFVGSQVNNATTQFESLLNPKVIQLNGTIFAPSLTDNARHTLDLTNNQSGIEFNLPIIIDRTVFHQMLVEMYMPEVKNIRWGTTNYFGGVEPDLSEAGYYTLIYEYDLIKDSWVVGALYKGGV